MPDKRERVRANMVVYLVCVALSLAIWTIQTLRLPQEVNLRVSFFTSASPPAPIASGQILLAATGFELMPFWFKSFWSPLEVPADPAIQANHHVFSSAHAMQSLKTALPPDVDILELSLDSMMVNP